MQEEEQADESDDGASIHGFLLKGDRQIPVGMTCSSLMQPTAHDLAILREQSFQRGLSRQTFHCSQPARDRHPAPAGAPDRGSGASNVRRTKTLKVFQRTIGSHL